MSVSSLQSSLAAQLAAQIALTNSTASQTGADTATAKSSPSQNAPVSLQATIQALTDQLQTVLLQLQQAMSADSGGALSDPTSTSSGSASSGQTGSGQSLAQLIASDLGNTSASNDQAFLNLQGSLGSTLQTVA